MEVHVSTCIFMVDYAWKIKEFVTRVVQVVLNARGVLSITRSVPQVANYYAKFVGSVHEAVLEKTRYNSAT